MEEIRGAPVRWMLVQLGELPVYWVDVHVVVLLKVLRQQLNRVIPGMQTSLTLKDFLHLRREQKEHSWLLSTELAGFIAKVVSSTLNRCLGVRKPAVVESCS